MATFLKRGLLVVALPALLFAAWWFSSAGSTNFFLPPLSKIMESFGALWLGPRFVTDILPSLGRLLLGYAIAVVAGVTLGTVLGLNARVRQAAEPVLEFFRAIPPPALVPIFLLIIGIGDETKLVVIATGAVWPILLNTVEGVRGYDSVLSDTSATFGIRGWRRLKEFILPGALPFIVAGMRTGLSIAIILMVISEMFAPTTGLGASIILAQRSFAIPDMWSGVLVLGLIGFGLAMLFRLFERRILSWYEGLKGLERR